MAYEKYTWVDGELITAEKLNHMEGGIAEGGGGEAGYECTEETTELFNDTITTVQTGVSADAEIANVPHITADEITVTVDGTEYVCPKVQIDADCIYGGVDPDTGNWDFTDYPFAIASYGANDTWFITENAGTYTVKVEALTETVTTTPCFEKAVKTVVDRGYECNETITPLFDEIVTTVQDGDDVTAQLDYSEPITADKIIVAFNGTQYICPKIIVDSVGNMVFYGGMSETGDLDFTNYPFVIISRPDANYIGTETANTYHIEVAAAVTEATNISPCFVSAVKKASASSRPIKTATLSADDVSVDGLTTVLLRPLPDDYVATVGVISIFPLETEDVYINGFDCSGDRGRFYLNYMNKQASPVTIDHVQCVFAYISDSGDK